MSRCKPTSAPTELLTAQTALPRWLTWMAALPADIWAGSDGQRGKKNPDLKNHFNCPESTSLLFFDLLNQRDVLLPSH